MSNTTRASILKGPAFIGYDSASIHAEGDITVDLVTEYFDVTSSAHGNVGRRPMDRRVEVNFAPRMWKDLAKLFPYATKQIGDRLFPAADKALVITPRNGAPLTILNAAITQLPNINLGAQASALGGMRFTGLVIDGGDPADLDDLFTLGTVATGATMTGFDLTAVPNSKYTLTRNSVDMLSEAGFAIAFDLGIEPVKGDGETTIDYIVTNLGATLSFSPWGMNEAAFRSLLDATGMGEEPTGHNAVIAGAATGKPSVTLANTYPAESGQLGYGATLNRTGQVTLRAVRKVTSDALSALWTIGTVA